MFDPQTAQLIRNAPALSQLDLERLPQKLTEAFTAIVTFRVRMTENSGPLPEMLRNQLEEFRRLANTYESFVILLPNRENRAAAAYVAAQAHHLLVMARRLEQVAQVTERHLRLDAISSSLSAMLLFLIADQPSDAMEMAKYLRETSEPGSEIERVTVEALALLGEGKPRSISNLQVPEFSEMEELEQEAAQALFLRLLNGIRILGDRLSHGVESSTTNETPADIFREVQEMAVGELEQPSTLSFPSIRALTTYPGPHHLAGLLLPASACLEECATSNVLAPSGTNATRWGELRNDVVKERPFLWRNHRDAVAQGFLEVGTSAVVSFPTGAGKTTLSELKVASALSAEGDVLYLAPTHALVSQVRRSLQQTFPSVVVGDSLVAEDFYVEIGEDSLARIAVMTPERCLALVSSNSGMFSRVRLVIFDECHLLHPQASGRTRRSVDAMLSVLHLARIASEADWLLLSAMMSNAEELSGWLSELTGRKCLALKLDWKPTRQARGCLVFEQKEIERLQQLVRTEQTKASTKNPPKDSFSLYQARPFGFFCLEQTWQSTKVRDYTLQPLLDGLVQFSVSRAPNKTAWHLDPNKTEIAAHIAAQCAQRGLRVLLFGQTIPITSKLAQLIEQHLNSRVPSYTLLEHEKSLQKWATLEVGATESLYCCDHHLAGCHHGDMLPVERELVEQLFRRPGGIRALAATTTLSQGVNLPADIVFIVGDARWDSSSGKNQMLEAHELLNAAGRAGRAGQVAQGVVVVLPNFLVEFGLHPKPRIGKGWTELRSGIFSKPDQCLRIQDPVQMILDLLQDPARCDDPEVQYFLRRIPTASEADPDAPAKFLRSSLAAYHSRQQKNEAVFEKKILSAITSRDVTLKKSEAVEWQVEMACRAGVNPDIILQLDRDLLALADNRPVDVEGWLRWFCEWLGDSEFRRKALLRLEPKSEKEKDQQLELFGDKLFELIWAWMSGEPLTALEVMLGGKRDKLGKCSLARHFVLRRIPEIAYAIGFVTQVYRQHLELDLVNGRMPVALGTISLCVRAGQSSPEELATRFELNEPLAARQSVRAVWNECSRVVDRGDAEEPFAKTRARVAVALGKIVPPSSFSKLVTNIDTIGASTEDEMPWDNAAREAVEDALANAYWDTQDGTITLYDLDDHRISTCVTSREELEEYLRSIATDAFYGNCSRDEGEYISDCDEDEIVENALAKLDERLKTFFRKRWKGNC